MISGKEQFLNEFSEASQPGVNILAVVGGAGAAILDKELPLFTSRQDLKNLENFSEWLSGSPKYLKEYQEALPQIEKMRENITELKDKIDVSGFNPWAAAIGVGTIALFRLSTKPLVAELAKKLQREKKPKSARVWRAVDNFWLATQTFLLVNMVNTVLHGGPKNEVEKGLSYAGGVVFAGGALHTLIEVGIRHRKKPKQRKEIKLRRQ